jgi:phosphonate transport system substrate-binding protein
MNKDTALKIPSPLIATITHALANKLRCCLLLSMLATIAVTCNPAVAEQASATELSFGIVPQQSASKLARLWAPILLYLDQRTNLKLRFRTASNIPEFERRLAAGKYDIAYMNPYHYTVFHQDPGYVAFAKEKDKQIRGIIVVAEDSHYQQLEDLDGLTLAFPSPAAFAASLLTRAYLRREGVSFTPKYVSSHDSVYRTVAKRIYGAGGGITRTFNNVDPAVRSQLRILWTSQGYTPHAIASHPRVPSDTVMTLQRAMVAMDQDKAGQDLLHTINFNGIEPASDSDWDDVRGLQIQALENLVSQ